MLARLESGVSRFELFGTATVLLAFGAVELFGFFRTFGADLVSRREAKLAILQPLV
jgi:hypothetical protein